MTNKLGVTSSIKVEGDSSNPWPSNKTLVIQFKNDYAKFEIAIKLIYVTTEGLDYLQVKARFYNGYWSSWKTVTLT